MSAVRGYVFGPLEKRGALAGLRLGQLVIFGVALVLALMIFSLSSVIGQGALVIALGVLAGAVGLGFIQPGGRGVDEWIPVIFAWFMNSGNKAGWISTMPAIGDFSYEDLSNRISFENEPPQRGPRGRGQAANARSARGGQQRSRGMDSRGGKGSKGGKGGRGQVDPRLMSRALPPSLQGLKILDVPVAEGNTSIGVVKDEKSMLYTAVLAVRGDAFALLDAGEKARRLQSWADVLGSMARPSSYVHRVQWIERAVPDDGDAFNRYLAEAKVQSDDAPTVRSYIDLLQEFGPISQQHETFIAVQISAASAGRIIKKAGGGDKGACLVLLREVRQLMESLYGADIHVDGALSPRLLSGVIRNAIDPLGRRELVRRGRRDPERAGASPKSAWPMATQTAWDHYRTERAYHATFWIAEWPRLEVGPDFMAPLMVRTQRIRTVSMVMQPIDPAKAQREVESAHTAYVSDEELRGRAGYMPNERRRRELEGVLRREQELADGFSEYRFSGYVSVTGSTIEELEEACSEVEQSASQAHIELRRLYGEQDVAFSCVLPLCRGLN